MDKDKMSEPKKVSAEEVKYLSELIRVEVKEADVPELRKDLTNMFAFIARMNEIDVSGFEPLFSPLDGDINQRAQTPMAEDKVRPGLTSAEMEANAPNFRLGHFVVPQVIDE